MNKIEVKIEILSYAKTIAGSFIVILSELNSTRKLPIVLKATDAQYIAIKMESVPTPRPMTQDLFQLLTDGYGIDIEEVLITNVSEGIFYAYLVTSNGMEKLNIECTVGDALSMSVLYNCPIFVNEEVLISTGIDGLATSSQPTVQDNSLVSSKKVPKKKPKPETIDSLDEMLKDALELEDYETAVKLRDRIAKLKKND